MKVHYMHVGIIYYSKERVMDFKDKEIEMSHSGYVNVLFWSAI
jgi:hypothetical protein